MATNEACNSRNIPLPMQREVRQRCGFGCVICGMPLYDYDHIVDWAIVKEHEADKITLLCDQHHREKGSGLLPSELVINANLYPRNLNTGLSKPYDLHYFGDTSCFSMGQCRFWFKKNVTETCTFTPIRIDDEDILSFKFEDNQLFLSANVFDEQSTQILKISNNQLVYSVKPWDIQFIGKKLTIRQGHGRIAFEITFRAPNEVQVNRANLIYKDKEIVISEKNIRIYFPNSEPHIIQGHDMGNYEFESDRGRLIAAELNAGIVIGDPTGPFFGGIVILSS